MRLMGIGAVVSYCTNEYRFLSLCLSELWKFCDEVVVAVGEKLVDGSGENRELLNLGYAEESGTQFIEYKYDKYGIYPICEGVRHMHGVSRYVGYHGLSRDIDRVLFVDVDEIIDGERFTLSEADVGHFSSYLYIKDEKTRALAHQNTVLLVRRGVLEPEMLLNHYERPGYFWGHLGNREGSILGGDGLPMVHHYNWVRSKPELLKKVATWGHRGERDWERLILEERYSELTPFTYEQVEPVHSVLHIDVESLKSISRYRHIPRESFPNVTYVTPQDIYKKSIHLLI